MSLAHVTKTGNVSIPKEWRKALGIEPNSNVIIHKLERKIVIEPLKQEKFHDTLAKIDDEVKKKKITFSREEAVKDDFYD
ncbi:AbrB/MazE/SpoVT family DNA-binding domain-containing protein [Candidatus Woesearchaeota archaeon]|nr:AbrB/MazE/SpoVT family DNA-binding domain-containing protein [Candidatus Woesearchaeota archaeon]